METVMANRDKGFGSMPAAKKRLIASLGGKAAHAQGRAHQWTKETAKIAGAKGGRTSAARKKERKQKAEGEELTAL